MSGAGPLGTKGGTHAAVALAALVWLLVELLRGWTPLLITVFGRAAETPPELLGAFALAVTAAPLLVLLVAGSPLVRARESVVALGGVALVVRSAVPFVGGQPLLVITSVGFVVALLALAVLVARRGEVLVPGLIGGLAMSAVSHAALGTWAGVWRHDVAGVLVALVLVALCLVGVPAVRSVTEPGPGAERSGTDRARSTGPSLPGWLVMPVVLLTGIALASPARASVAATGGAVVVAAAAAFAVGLALLTWGTRVRVVAGVALVGSVAVTMLPDPLPGWSLVGFAVGMPALAIVLGAPARSVGASVPSVGVPAQPAGPARSVAPVRVARSVAGGAVLFTVLLFGFYAGYDLGYRADLLVVAVSVLVVVAALWRRSTASGVRADPHSSATRPPLPPRDVAVAAGAAVVAATLAAVGPMVTVRELPPSSAAGQDLRLAAWNVRMGHGMDGTSKPRDVARLLRDEGADVVLLSEVDRGWLLNGGQEHLSVLSRTLGYEHAFGPAGDQVWGEAVLSRWPIRDVSSIRLPAHESLTGAQALAVTIEAPQGPVRVIATHIQPDASGEDPALPQARDLAVIIERERAGGLPLVVGGDLNLEPGSRAWDALLGAGVTDALADERPVPTWSSEDPQDQIDHVLVSDGVNPSAAHAPSSLLSDHLPVVVDLALP